MNRIISIPVTAIAIATALTFFSCSDDDGGEGSPVKKAKISGVSQKGPFIEGSTVTLYELNDKFGQTGRNFRDIIADNKGSFEIRNVELASPYAMLEASGFYRNEVTGQVSTAPITLFAIADIREKDQVNVNILTHLEYYRVLDLVNSGKTVSEAKKQAQKEIFAVFGIDSDSFKDSEDMSIFGNTDSDAALLAISVLLQGNLSEGEFSQRLTNFSQAVKNSGTWDNEEAKAAMAEWATEADKKTLIYCYYDSPSNCWAMPTNDMCISGTLVSDCSDLSSGGSNLIATSLLAKIRSNVLAWGLSSEIPDFEKYIRDCIGGLGFGICGERIYDLATHTCSDGTIYGGDCNGKAYDIANQKCENGILLSGCNFLGSIFYYNPETQFCTEPFGCNGALGNRVYDKCNSEIYKPGIQECKDGVVVDVCGEAE